MTKRTIAQALEKRWSEIDRWISQQPVLQSPTDQEVPAFAALATPVDLDVLVDQLRRPGWSVADAACILAGVAPWDGGSLFRLPGFVDAAPEPIDLPADFDPVDEAVMARHRQRLALERIGRLMDEIEGATITPRTPGKVLKWAADKSILPPWLDAARSDPLCLAFLPEAWRKLADPLADRLAPNGEPLLSKKGNFTGIAKDFPNYDRLLLHAEDVWKELGAEKNRKFVKKARDRIEKSGLCYPLMIPSERTVRKWPDIYFSNGQTATQWGDAFRMLVPVRDTKLLKPPLTKKQIRLSGRITVST